MPAQSGDTLREIVADGQHGNGEGFAIYLINSAANGEVSPSEGGSKLYQVRISCARQRRGHSADRKLAKTPLSV